MDESKIDEIIAKTYNYIFKNLNPITAAIREHIEGNLFDSDAYLPKRRNVTLTCQNKKNALEIGFNAGYSAVLILLANPDIQLTCVDIASHRYTIPCYQQIKKDFGDRINLLVGDSQVIVPTINDKFDFIHIDGCHIVEVAENDIKNTNKLVMDNTTIIMDDTNLSELANLWDRLANEFNYKKPSFEIYATELHNIRVT